MPQPVLDYLSAPVPLLIGLSAKLLESNSINYFEPNDDLNDEINWIHLDNEKSSLWNKDDFRMPYLSNLKERISEDYEFIRCFKKNLVEVQSDIIYEKVQNIANTIRETLFTHFIQILPAVMNTEEPLNLSELEFKDESDRAFFEEFYYTLMYTSYINDAYKQE